MDLFVPALFPQFITPQSGSVIVQMLLLATILNAIGLIINGKSFLFDTGYSDVFLCNAAILGINISNIDSVIFSHGHNDHSGGLTHLAQYLDRTNHHSEQKIKLVAHPNAFVPKYYENKSIGAHFPADGYPTFFERIDRSGVYYITDNLLFLGEIERSNDFEGLHPIGKLSIVVAMKLTTLS